MSDDPFREIALALALAILVFGSATCVGNAAWDVFQAYQSYSEVSGE